MPIGKDKVAVKPSLQAPLFDNPQSFLQWGAVSCTTGQQERTAALQCACAACAFEDKHTDMPTMNYMLCALDAKARLTWPACMA